MPENEDTKDLGGYVTAALALVVLFVIFLIVGSL